MKLTSLIKISLLGIMFTSPLFADTNKAQEALKGGDWENWGCCQKKCIKADEIDACHAKINELCAHKAKIEKLWSELMATDELFAEKARIDQVWSDKVCSCILHAEKAKIDQLLSELIYANNLYAQNAELENLDADNAHITNMCVDNINTKYNAEAIMTVPVIGYQFASDILFDTFAYDPNNNLSNTSGATTYTVPVTGWYIIDFQNSLSNLRGGTLTGTGDVHPNIFINGQEVFHQDVPMLSFNTAQKTHLTALAHLTAGDIVTVNIHLYYLDPSTGFSEFSGVGDLFGATIPQDPNGRCHFAIHYLSSDTTPATCPSITIEKPTIPPCFPCHIEKPHCEVDCHDGECCNNQCNNNCNNNSEHDGWNWHWDNDGQH